MPEENLRVNLVADNKKLQQGLTEGQKQLQDFGKTVTQIGGLIGAAFGTRELFRFTADAVKMAGAAQGIREAFKRIADDKVLDDLRKATHGTVNELELMRRTVQASNFQLPLENLATLFEFATKRAQQTGESVDYLVNSIVLGIGRKSPLILDNLGISAVRLRQELKGTGVELTTVGDIAAAVGKIAQEEMSKAGGVILTTKTRFEQVKASADNFQESLGKTIIEVWEIDDSLDSLNETIKKLTDSDSMPLMIQYLKSLKDAYITLINPIRGVTKGLDLQKGALKEWLDENTMLFKNLDVLFKKGLVPERAKGLPFEEAPETGIKENLVTEEMTLEGFKKRHEALKREAELAGITEKAWREYMSYIMDYSPKTTKVVIQDFTGLMEAEENVIDETDDLIEKWQEGMEAMQEAADIMAAGTKSAFMGLATGIGELLGNIITGTGNFGDQMAMIMADIAKQMGRTLLAMGSALMLVNPAKGLALIAKGIALTAYGQIATNLVSQANTTPNISQTNGSTQRIESTEYNAEEIFIGQISGQKN